MANRKENALKTRQKLLDTAEKLLKNKGFNNVSVEDITKNANVAKGTFYVYFKHKENILTEICRGYFKKIELQLDEMKSSNIEEKLTVYVDEFMNAVEIYGINICREWIKGVIDPNHANEDMDKSKWKYDYDMLEGILKTAIKNKELKKNTPVELLTHLIISELYGMMTVWCMSDGVFEPKDWTKKFCEIQLKEMLGNFIIKKGKL